MKELTIASYIKSEPFFEGQRVLLDFMDEFHDRDYMLVGNTNHGFVAVASENHASPNYLPRRFRFNIGALHQYVYVGESQVKYADEFKSGDMVYIGNGTHAKTLPIARVKKEIRQFVKLTFECQGNEISVILQADATSAVLCPEGIKLIGELKAGDGVYVLPWGKASHLGSAKEEFVEEF